jgi:hypothetical protein
VGAIHIINKSRKKDRINQIQESIKIKRVIPDGLLAGTARNNPGRTDKIRV